MKTILIGVIAVVVLILIVTIFVPIRFVQAGTVSLVTRFGAATGTVLQPGLHILSPFSETETVDLRQTKEQTDADAASNDLQDVKTTVAVNFHFEEGYALQLFKEIGLGDAKFNRTVVDPAIQNAVKATTAQFTAEELITKRNDVSMKIEDALKLRLAPYAVLDSVSITDFQFSPSFNAAIEAKVTAEQDALAAKNKLAQVQYEAQQTEATAVADAQAIEIKAKALKENPDLVNLEWAQRWNGILPTTMLSGTIPQVWSSK